MAAQAGATETVNFYGYVSGFNFLRIGYASAIMVCFFVMLMLVIACQACVSFCKANSGSDKP